MGRVGFQRALLALCLCGLAACGDKRSTVSVDGTLELQPSNFDFQQVAVHDGRALPVTLRNVGRARLGVKGVAVQSAAGRWLVGLPDGTTAILPGQTVKGTITFQPAAPGPAEGMLVVTTDSPTSPRASAPLQGVGVDATGTVKESLLDFGTVEVMDEKRLTLTLSNPSTLPVEISARIVGAGSDEFSMSGVTLQPGQTVQQDVSFHPQREGKKRVALAVTPCKGCGDVLVTLLGEAVVQALVAEPPVVDFGQVPVDRTVTSPIVLRNLSSQPVTVSDAQLVASDVDFHLGGTPLPLVVPGNGTATIDVSYTVTKLLPATGTVRLTLSTPRHPTLDVGLRGRGGAAELCVAPLILEFGPHAVGTRTAGKVAVRNCGVSGKPFDLTAATLLAGPTTQFEVGPLALPVTLAAGAEVDVPVAFVPTRSGDVSEQLELVTTLPSGTVDVTLQSKVTAGAPCTLEVAPAPPGGVDFGTVVPGAQSLLGIKVTNAGADVCVLSDLRLGNDGGGTFTLPAGSITSLPMQPGEYFTTEVSFQAPQAAGTFQGEVDVTGTGQPTIAIPLKARTVASCLVATPGYVDFGLASPQCPATPQQIDVRNDCTAPVTVSSATIGAGSTDGEFLFAAAPPVPQTLAPGAGLTLDVKYLAQVPGLNLSPLYVANSLYPDPLLVPLIGESDASGVQTDRFLQGNPGQVDVLFVVDNTASMLEEQPRLVAAMPAFADAAQSAGVDLHVGVTTTGIDPIDPTCPGGASGGEAGRLFPADNSGPRQFTSATPNLGQALQRAVQVGQCAFVEQGLEAARRALTQPLVNSADDPRTPLPNDGNAGFYRDTAALAVVVVSDENDHSPDTVATYVRWLQSLKGENGAARSALYAIVPSGESCPTASGSGVRYAEAAAATGGAVESICAADFAPLLRDVAGRVFGAQVRFPLRGKPAGGVVTVTVNGTVVSDYTYDPGANVVVFAAPPPAGATIEVRYTRACS